MLYKFKRPQTIIGIGEVIAGLSYFLAELFSGGFGMSWPFTFWQWVSIFGIATGAGLIIWGLLKTGISIMTPETKPTVAPKKLDTVSNSIKLNRVCQQLRFSRT